MLAANFPQEPPVKLPWVREHVPQQLSINRLIIKALDQPGSLIQGARDWFRLPTRGKKFNMRHRHQRRREVSK